MQSASRCRTRRQEAGGRMAAAAGSPSGVLSTALRFSREAVDAAVSIVLGPLCAACHEPLDEPTRGAVCQSCWSSIVPITPPCCRTCGDPLPTWRGAADLQLQPGAADDRCRRCVRTEPVISL